jgi:hypothetical protein
MDYYPVNLKILCILIQTIINGFAYEGINNQTLLKYFLKILKTLFIKRVFLSFIL